MTCSRHRPAASFSRFESSLLPHLMKNFALFACFLALTSLAPAAVPSSRSLFNGRDLTGWKGSGYEVKDGAIVSTPDGKVLFTEEIFANYVLELEYKLTPGGNSGIGINYPGTGDATTGGFEIQILDDTAKKHQDLKEGQHNGSIYLLAPAKKKTALPVGEWNKQKVTVIGSAIVVELNGQIIVRANLNELSEKNPELYGLMRRSGHIAIAGHGETVSFRNIQITETAPAANVDGVRAAGFSPIFDGKSLAGWKHSPSKTTEWIAVNGIIKHTGKVGEPQDLWTVKDYGNFTLVFDWRWAGRGPQKFQPVVQADGNNQIGADGEPLKVEIEELDSGVYLRGNQASQVNLWNWPIGSGEVYGYRTNPAMAPEIRAQVTPKVRADYPIGEWNRTMITLIGDRLSVSINGRVAIKDAQLPEIPARGPIGLQHHGAAIDFANLWIKEF